MKDPIISAIYTAVALDAQHAVAWERGGGESIFVKLSAAKSLVSSLTPVTDHGAKALAIWIENELKTEGDASQHILEAAARLAEWAIECRD